MRTESGTIAKAGRMLAAAGWLLIAGVLAADAARAGDPRFDDRAAEMRHERVVKLVPKKGATVSDSWSSDVRVVFGRRSWDETVSDAVVTGASGRYTEKRRDVRFKLSKASKRQLADDLAHKVALLVTSPPAPPTSVVIWSPSIEVRIEKIVSKGSAARGMGSFGAKTVVRFVAKNPDTGERWKGKYRSKGSGPLVELGPGPFSIDVAASPAAGGAVELDPDLAAYPSGTRVSFTARPASGYVFTSWSGGLAGAANPATVTVSSDLAVTAHFAAQSFDLGVRRGGLGIGSVSGSGIDCGDDCDESFPAGTDVTLTAAAAAGSAFSGWQGCASATGAVCQVSMDEDRTVTAVFGITGSQVSITSLPATDADGSYVLAWRCSGFVCSTTHSIQEDDSLAFTSPTTYSCTASGGSPGCSWSAGGSSFTFSGKADGTWCYRVRDAGVQSAWSEPRCVTVARPAQAAVLRLVNRTSYDLLDIRLNGRQMTVYPEVIPVGGSFDFVFTTAGNVHLELGNGYWVWDWDIDAFVRDVWFTFGGDTSVAIGQTTTVNVDNPTIGQLLTRYSGQTQDWTGPYYDANGLPHYARLRFWPNSAWTLFDSPQVCALPPQCSFQTVGTGQAEMTAWPAYSLGPSFRLCLGCEETDFLFPFGVLNVHNGPPSHAWIQYTPD